MVEEEVCFRVISLLLKFAVDGQIHRAAGRRLLTECEKLNGCEVGETKITQGFKLPARYVLHTVGPKNHHEVPKLKTQQLLASCYKTCLDLLVLNELKTIAFCCISTGIFGYPNKPACKVALRTVRDWLETDKNYKKIDRIVFCIFTDVDLEIYEKQMPKFFP